MPRPSCANVAAFALTAIVLLSSRALASPEDTAGTQWTIVASYPIPEGASGLAYDGTYLYCGIYGSAGSDIYRIDPANGNYSLLLTGPQEDAFGLTYDGQYLWTTDHTGSSSTPAVAMQFDWSGNLVAQFDLPEHYMSGIAYDGSDFWVARYYSDPSQLYKVDATGAIQTQFEAPDNQPWDLTIQGADLWIADYYGDALYRVKASTGDLVESHASEGVDPAGIVWDGQFLWYCDNGEDYAQDYLYKVDLSGSGTPAIVLPVTDYDYGPIVIGDSTTWNVTIQNAGAADLIISDVVFTPPADLSNPDALPITILPAGNAQLALVYSPTAFTPLDAIATVSSNDPIHPNVEITLTGHGVYFGPTIDILQPAHDYGQVRANATTRWYMTIRNAGSDTLTIDDITSDDIHFYIDDATTLPVEITTLSTVDIGVWFSPNDQSNYNGTVSVYSNDPGRVATDVTLSGEGLCADYAAGQTLWSHLIDTSYDNTPKAIATIPDINGDGVADVIVCSEDDYVRCFNGGSDQTADILWEHEIYAGAVYSPKALQITEDIDGDGYNDLVVGAAWGARLIRALSGKTGRTIWTHDTHEYGDGGWIYALDNKYDYNNDGVADVLAATGNDGDNTGPKRAYCLDGLTGISIWETPLGGAGFSVIGVDDFTGDGQPDAVAGASNADETQGWVFGIDGVNGQIRWSFQVSSSSVWALEQIDDITGDDVRDVIVGDFNGNIYGLDATNGGQRYSNSGYSLITRFERLDDVNGDGHPDILPAHLGTTARVIDGQTGNPIWSKTLADKPAAVARIADVTGDGINDVLIGTLFNNNYVYLLDGVDGTILEAINYGTPVDAIAAIPDIVGEGLWEMVAGGRNGLLTCFAGSSGDPCSRPEPPIQAPAPHDILKNRYISIDPSGEGGANVGRNLDIRLTLTSTLVNGVTGVGSQWWANAPDAGCISIVGPTRPVVAPNWDACPVLHLTGCPIIPTSSYDIVVADGAMESAPPLVAQTQALPLGSPGRWWGDCVGQFDPVADAWGPPNGVVAIDDAVAAIKTFQNPSSVGPGCGTPPCNATHVSVTDVQPHGFPGTPFGTPNRQVDINDVFGIIMGFQGVEYPGPAIDQCP